jgi:transcriptional regulator with XRE-family HTH domain
MVVSAPDFGCIQYGCKIGKRIRKFRKDRGLKQEDIEQKLKSVGLDMSNKVLSRLERGKRRDFTLREIEALAYVLQVSIQDLWSPVGGWKL